MLGQFRLVAPGVLRTVFGESADFHPAQENPLEEHEVERDGGDLGTCETEADETPAPRGGTERRFAVGTTDRVDHHVGAASGELFDPLLEILVAVVDRLVSAPRPAHS